MDIFRRSACLVWLAIFAEHALHHHFLEFRWLVELRPMSRLLKPDELFAARRFQSLEVLRRDLARCHAIAPPFEEVNWDIEPRRALEKIDREELAPEMIEGKLRAAHDSDQVEQAVIGREESETKPI